MIYQDLEGLVQAAIDRQLIEPADHIYSRNQVMHLLKLDAFPERLAEITTGEIPDLLGKLVDYAIHQQIIHDVFDEKEMLAADIMNCFVARPSVIRSIFHNKVRNSPDAATDYFYQLSQNSNYIQMNRIQKNIHFKADTTYGEMDITINLSKPEKDPEQIKRERELKQTVAYPRCPLCVENEGYAGRTGHPARSNHRVIPVDLLDENWYLQYSPYVYYNEHCIVLAEKHRPMKIDKNTFQRLIQFTTKFPHYFLGSNADLPIVGGSILSHDHYQGGRYEFAMTKATEAFRFQLQSFDQVTASVLNWPLSVIRLTSVDAEPLLGAADHVLQTWRTYTDSRANIEAYSGDTPHNTITPIARMRDGKHELDLVLRNNRISDEHPLGIFHPHADVQHIKKENIGLIEVMGLAVLPARLKDELRGIRQYLLGGDIIHVAAYHQDWAQKLKHTYGTIKSSVQADTILQTELAKKFSRVLEDAGVFKNKSAFERFINTLNKEV